VRLPVAALDAARLILRAVITIEAEGGGRIVVRAVADEVDKFEGQLPFVWVPNAPSSQSLTPPDRHLPSDPRWSNYSRRTTIVGPGNGGSRPEAPSA
jgi:formylmethanofuran dehydrogenase subunit D